MRILYVNNDGSGFADYVSITDGTTVEQFFTIKMEGVRHQPKWDSTEV